MFGWLFHLSGDMNFAPHDKPMMKIADPNPEVFRCTMVPRHSASRAGQSMFEHALRDWVEITQPYYTHYDATSQQLSQIDRIWVAVPPGALCNATCQVEVLNDPVALARKFTSDHSAVRLSVEAKARVPWACRPLPREVCEHPLFTKMLETVCKKVNFQ